jgi:starch phosphorylase
VGWALGDGHEHGDDYGWDAREAEALYDLLERQVVPEFYSRNENGIPEQWISRMRKSMAILTPRFSANRVVREYTETYYLPAARNYIKRAAGNGKTGIRIAQSYQDLQQKWPHLQIGNVRSEKNENGLYFQVPVQLNGIDASKLSVVLYAEGISGAPSVKIDMEPVKNASADGACFYEKRVDTARSAGDFTVCIIPHYEDISVPLEDNHILWQR